MERVLLTVIQGVIHSWQVSLFMLNGEMSFHSPIKAQLLVHLLHQVKAGLAAL